MKRSNKYRCPNCMSPNLTNEDEVIMWGKVRFRANDGAHGFYCCRSCGRVEHENDLVDVGEVLSGQEREVWRVLRNRKFVTYRTVFQYTNGKYIKSSRQARNTLLRMERKGLLGSELRCHGWYCQKFYFDNNPLPF